MAEELRATAYENLLPPLVPRICAEVAVWRENGYRNGGVVWVYTDA